MKCAFTDREYNDPADGVWDDGEWISWDYINQYVDDADGWESDSRPQAIVPTRSTLQLWELLDDLVQTAKNYLEVTGRHLPIFGELGELYGEIKFGIKRHRPNTPGSDGRMGNDFVEIKTISPLKSNDTVLVKRAGNFNKLLIVKISEEFRFEAKMVDRKSLKKGSGKYAKASWGKVNDTEK
ncbi:MAG: hypothetical protein WAL92_10940 [Thiogranum sp.]